MSVLAQEQRAASNMRTSKWTRLLAILILLAWGCMNLTVLAAAEKGPEIKFFFPKQVLRGETTEITVQGWDLKGIQSVEVTPSEGVSVGAIQEQKWMMFQRGGKYRKPWPWSKELRGWTLELVVGQNAQPGERSVVVVTPEGRLAAQTIRIPNHIPRITEVKILSTKLSEKGSGDAVEFEAAVFDEAGDLGAESHMMVAILCGRELRHERVAEAVSQWGSLAGVVSSLCPSCSSPRERASWEATWVKLDRVTAKDSTNAVVHVSEVFGPNSGYFGGISMISRRGHVFFVSGRAGEQPVAKRNETCEMQISIQDQNGNVSKNVSMPVEFK